MTYEEYKRNLKAKEDTGTVTGRIMSKKAISTIEFLENSTKSAKIIKNEVKTIKWDSKEADLTNYKTFAKHFVTKQPAEVPQTDAKMRVALRKHRTDSTPDPNAAFRRKKREEFSKRITTTEAEKPNNDDNLLTSRAIAGKLLDDIDDMIDEYDDWDENYS